MVKTLIKQETFLAKPTKNKERLTTVHQSRLFVIYSYTLIPNSHIMQPLQNIQMADAINNKREIEICITRTMNKSRFGNWRK